MKAIDLPEKTLEQIREKINCLTAETIRIENYHRTITTKSNELFMKMEVMILEKNSKCERKEAQTV